MPLIAEDLGVITPDVEALRDGLELPGMAILQFAFEDQTDGYGHSAFLPHNHQPRLVVYTGTHDNNTIEGWWAEKDAATQGLVHRYLNTDGEPIHWAFIRAALASVARLALFPMQDVLGVGAEATMNRPGTAEGNWTWRLAADGLDPGERRAVAGPQSALWAAALSAGCGGVADAGPYQATCRRLARPFRPLISSVAYSDAVPRGARALRLRSFSVR